MLTKIVFHLGFHKTGTTVLQELLFSKIPEINYFRKFDFTTEIKPNTLNLISYEHLTGHPHLLRCDSHIMYTVADRIKNCFPNAKIILGIRNKELWQKSLYSQYIINGGILNFEEFKENIDSGYLNFEKFIEYLKTKFSDVYVYRFEDLKKNHQKCMDELCKFIGVKPLKVINEQFNISLSNNQIKFLRFLNGFLNSQFTNGRIVPQKFLRKILVKIRKTN